MREILRITLALTVSCLIAALVMGSVFTVTDKAKKRNEHLEVQETMKDLLAYSEKVPKASKLGFHTFYRYILEEDGKQYMGYMLPVEQQGEITYKLLVMDLKGAYVKTYDVDLSPELAREQPDRTAALTEALGSAENFTYADSATVATRGDKREAYLVPGEFPGFKTFIEVMLALNPSFDVIGLEIMEHEEDPGLGGEIEQKYFKNQFKGLDYQQVMDLDVVKKPMPEKYKTFLEAGEKKQKIMSKEEIEKIREKYKDSDIYALTGATISSRAVTDGVKGIVSKFAYRVKTLEELIQEQDIPVSF